MDEHPSQTAAAVDAVLRVQGYNLRDYLADQVDEKVSHRRIAEQLADKTDGFVTVSYETVRRWCDFYGIESRNRSAA
jgi:hypothetical protein